MSQDALASALLKLLHDLDDGTPVTAAKAALCRSEGLKLTDVQFDELILSLQRQLKLDVVYKGQSRTIVPHSTTLQSLPTRIEKERDIEPFVEGYLWRHFHDRFLLSEPQNYNLIVNNTARGGVADGVWKRPDVTVAVVSRYAYHPVPQLELFGFELKMPDGCRVPAVHEALSHTASVHYAYLVVYLPDTLPADHLALRSLPQILTQAQIHGIGVIEIKDPRVDGTFIMRLRAQRREPALRRIDDFISNRFHRTYQLALQTWLQPGTQ